MLHSGMVSFRASVILLYGNLMAPEVCARACSTITNPYFNSNLETWFLCAGPTIDILHLLWYCCHKATYLEGHYNFALFPSVINSAPAPAMHSFPVSTTFV